MARYIDADKLIEALQTDYDREGAKADDMAMRGYADLSVKYGHGQFCYLNAIERVKDTPTADVVPKSEVAKLKQEIETLKDNNEHLAVMLMEAKTEVAREIFEEIEEGCVVKYGNTRLFNLDIFEEIRDKYIDNKGDK